MVRSILAVTLVAVLAVGANAYDFLYTGDTAMTHDAGSFGIKGSVVYLMADSWYNNDGDKESADDVEGWSDWKATDMWVPVSVYYSVMDNLEFGVQAKFGSLKDETTLEARDDDGTVEGSGLGDTWIWAKYMFLPEPMLTARVGVKVNTGTEPAGASDSEAWVDEDGDLATGDGQMDVDGAIMFGTAAGPGMFSGAVGYRYRMDQKDLKMGDMTADFTPGNEIHFQACYMYYINDMMSLGLAGDGYFGSDPEYDGKAITLADDTDLKGSNGVWVNPSFSYMMESGLELGVGFHYPLMGQNIDALWGFDAYVGWGM
jgi:hypothetical protein